MDKAGPQYWNDSWASSDIPAAVDGSDTRLMNHVNRHFHQMFLSQFDKSRTPSMSLLEIGCAKSAWLPYFAREFGFSVCGIDYSPVGCQMARAVLQANGVEAEVICADFFCPPEAMLGTFDVAVSFGVVEHFDDTASCLRAVSSFLKPGGTLITNIPNMVGWVGLLQKTLNRPVYEIHNLIDPASLRTSHEQAGLEVLECGHFLSTNFGVVNLIGISTNTAAGFLKKCLLGFLSRVSVLVWLIERRTGAFPPNRFSSPYINCISRKPLARART
jgi:2-polyprenyl-3-methyl-5-hydroxy-6-metoxy-1,4-benzoquinol methylase